MHLKSLVCLFFSLTARALAQSSPLSSSSAAPASSPTMQQTIDFLRDMNEKQGPSQVVTKGVPSEMSISVALKEPCSLILKSRYKNPSYFHGDTSLLDLARSEPTSVAIKPGQETSTPIYYVDVEHAYREVLSLDPIDDKPQIPVPPDAANLAGTITANSGSSITFVALDGRLMNYTPAKKAKLTTDAPGANVWKAVIADFAVGNLIFVNGNSAVNSPASVSTKGFASVSVAVTTDQETATRMAKALIHALVLCHKDDKPSPF